MKKWLILSGMLILAACSSENGEELTIEPKKLEAEEQALVDSTAMEFMEYFYLNGEFPKDYNIQLELEHYRLGEKIDPFSSMSSFPVDSFDNGLLAFGKASDLEGHTSFVVSTPAGKVVNSHEVDAQGGMLSSWGGLLEDPQVLEKEQPVYAAYYASTSGQSMESGGFLDENGALDMMRIQDLDHFYALAIRLVEEE
ncbi:hypothetical protein [Planococcus salinus]|uniref:Uncharacterized protein n=1 Tax=Planococcus salinus TaxID=1848460 RepID=A0A3M8P6B5_9BACL|nr:hypothetical protein [Planococcus salinus]RNF39205.1 hypothetical protein EEX84_10935 [Planococcus salinus]